jgi:hypothetical protein
VPGALQGETCDPNHAALGISFDKTSVVEPPQCSIDGVVVESGPTRQFLGRKTLSVPQGGERDPTDDAHVVGQIAQQRRQLGRIRKFVFATAHGHLLVVCFRCSLAA